MDVRRQARRPGTWVAAGALGAAVLLVALVGTPQGSPAQIEIGRGVQVLNADNGASRSAEDVDYDDADLELLATYLVEEDPLSADDPAAHRAAWEATVRVLPAWAVAEVRQLNLVTDGENGTLAMVHRSGVVDDRWILSIDPAESAEVLEDTLIHELAHLMTLRSDDLVTEGGDCDGVRIQIGCASSGSTLAAWAGRFWPGTDEPAVFDRDVFVTDYAASAVHEDLAESFLAYVTRVAAPTEPVLIEKFAFFDAHPELAAAAADLRARRPASGA